MTQIITRSRMSIGSYTKRNAMLEGLLFIPITCLLRFDEPNARRLCVMINRPSVGTTSQRTRGRSFPTATRLAGDCEIVSGRVGKRKSESNHDGVLRFLLRFEALRARGGQSTRWGIRMVGTPHCGVFVVFCYGAFFRFFLVKKTMKRGSCLQFFKQSVILR